MDYETLVKKWGSKTTTENKNLTYTELLKKWGSSYEVVELPPPPEPVPTPQNKLKQALSNIGQTLSEVPSSFKTMLSDTQTSALPKSVWPDYSQDIAPDSLFQGYQQAPVKLPEVTKPRVLPVTSAPTGEPSRVVSPAGQDATKTAAKLEQIVAPITRTQTSPAMMGVTFADDIAPDSLFKGTQTTAPDLVDRIPVDIYDMASAPVTITIGALDSLGAPAIARLFGVERGQYEEAMGKLMGGTTPGKQLGRTVGQIGGSIAQLVLLGNSTTAIAAKMGYTTQAARVASGVAAGVTGKVIDSYGAGKDAKGIALDAVKGLAYFSASAAAGMAAQEELVKRLAPVIQKYPEYTKQLKIALAAGTGFAKGTAGATAKGLVDAVSGETISIEEIVKTGLIIGAASAISEWMNKEPFTRESQGLKPGKNVRTREELLADGYEIVHEPRGIFVKYENGLLVDQQRAAMQVGNIWVYEADIYNAEKAIGRPLTQNEIILCASDSKYLDELIKKPGKKIRFEGYGKGNDVVWEDAPLQLEGEIGEIQRAAGKLESIVTGKPVQVEPAISITEPTQTAMPTETAIPAMPPEATGADLRPSEPSAPVMSPAERETAPEATGKPAGAVIEAEHGVEAAPLKGEISFKPLSHNAHAIMIGDTEIGQFRLSPADESDIESRPYLDRIDIDPAYRNQGYGTAAINMIANEFGAFYTAPDNADSKRWLDRTAEPYWHQDSRAGGHYVDQGFGVYQLSSGSGNAFVPTPQAQKQVQEQAAPVPQAPQVPAQQPPAIAPPALKPTEAQQDAVLALTGQDAKTFEQYRRAIVFAAESQNKTINITAKTTKSFAEEITSDMLKEHNLTSDDAHIAAKTEIKKVGDVINIAMTFLEQQDKPLTQEIIHEFAEVWCALWQTNPDYATAIKALTDRGVSEAEAKEMLVEMHTDGALGKKEHAEVGSVQAFKQWLGRILKRIDYFNKVVWGHLHYGLRRSIERFAEDGDSYNPWFYLLQDATDDIDETRYSIERKPWSQPQQAVSSKKTARHQIAAGFKAVKWQEGTTNADIGSGPYNDATEYLAEQGVTNLSWDIYNRPEAENAATVSAVQGGKADTATAFNVLNVIAEEDARLGVIVNAADAIKPDGTAYFQVYAGDSSGVGRTTKNGWQNNRRLHTYLAEVNRYFDDVTIKGNLIVAKKPKKNLIETAAAEAPAPESEAVRPTSEAKKPEIKKGEEGAKDDTAVSGRVPEGTKPETIPAAQEGRPAGRVGGEEAEGSQKPVRETTRPAGSERPDAGHEGTPEKVAASGAAGEDSEGADTGRGVEGTSSDTGTRTPASVNYHITEADNLGKGTETQKYGNNIEAIKLVKQLLEEGRGATAEEQAVLAKYVGWGGIKKAFNPNNSEASWQRRYTELKELLTPEEYEAAKSSIQNAHYTSQEVIEGMYDLVKQLGFERGKILEPGMGVGNFFGLMPRDMMAKSTLYGVELDTITGLIAKYLYPKASIQIKGLQETNLPNDYFDLTISNVPFSEVGIYDTRYKERHMLHDYFIIRMLDHLRPGGVLVSITSTGTMDKRLNTARKEMASRANFIGAIRLPNTAFKENANTEVTTDIVIFQKLGKNESPNIDQEFVWANWDHVTGLYVNDYFINNPEMMLGTLEASSKMYGGKSATLVPDGRSIKDVLDKLPKDIYKSLAAEASAKLPPAEVVSGDELAGIKVNTYFEKDGEIFFRGLEKATPIKFSPKEREIVKDINLVRKALRETYLAQLDADNKDAIIKAKGRLTEAYNSFVKKHGLVHKAIEHMADDADYILLKSLEKVDAKTKAVELADVFTYKEESFAPEDTLSALSVSLNRKGAVDIPYIAKLLGVSEDEVIDDLGTAIYINPTTDTYETADEYLSGDVRAKLKLAEQMASADIKFARNVEALKAVIPENIEIGDIGLRLGASWMPPDLIKGFAADILDIPWRDRKKLQIAYNPVTGSWEMDTGGIRISREKHRSEWGTSRRHAFQMLDTVLNMKKLEVKVDPTTKEKDVQELALAKQIAINMESRFKEWLMESENRASIVEEVYNDRRNHIKVREYDGSKLTFPGLAPHINLRSYQKDAVARIIFGKNVLLAHATGTGKTYSMIVGAAELKRLGIARKPMLVVPNNKARDFYAAYKELYPNSNIIVLDEKMIAPAKRKKVFAEIANNDFDAVIIKHSSFTMIPVYKSTEIEFIQQQKAELERIILEMKKDNMSTALIRRIEKAKDKLEEKLKELLDSPTDDLVTFEEMGIDALLLDEAHNYKNLSTYSQLGVPGVGSADGNKKTANMLMKTSYLNNIGGKIVFATATPISNSMGEMHAMMRYLIPDELSQYGLTAFDSWAADFGEIVTALEMTADGGFKARPRFSRFVNMPELSKLFRDFTDIVTADKAKLKLPEIATGEPELSTSEGTEMLHELIEAFGIRAQAVSKGPVEIGTKPNGDKKYDTIVLLNNDARAAAIDLRFMAKEMGWDLNDPALDPPDSKTNRMVQNVIQKYHESAKHKGTQLIFADLGIPDAFKSKDVRGTQRYAFDLYSDIKNKLIQGGIKEEEIAFIHEAKNDDQRDALMDKVNKGEVRVLIGTTAKMGEGINAQERIIALHHMDAPWKPAHVEQRDGRAVRHGNIFAELDIPIHIYRYITEGSFDSYMWQLLSNKMGFISQVFNADGSDRGMEDNNDIQLSWQEIAAIASGDPTILRKGEVDSEVARLKMLKDAHMKESWRMTTRLSELEKEIASKTIRVKKLKADLPKVKDLSGDAFEITIGKAKYTKRVEAAKALENAISNSKSKAQMTNWDQVKVGEYSGFDIMALWTGNIFPIVSLQGEAVHAVSWNGSGMGAFQSMQATIGKIGTALAFNEEKIIEHKRDIENISQKMGKEFPFEAELAELIREQAEIDTQLGLIETGEPPAAEETFDDYDDDDYDDDVYRLEQYYSDIADLYSEADEGIKLPEVEAAAPEPSAKEKKAAPKISLPSLKAETPRIGITKDDITKMIDKVVPLYTGRMPGGTPAEAIGVYRRIQQWISTRSTVSRDMRVLTHELGHGIDDMLQLKKLEYESELLEYPYVKALAAAKPNTTPETLLAEGVAEFFNYYLTDEKEAARISPLFYEYVDELLCNYPEVQDSLFQIRSAIRAYEKQDARAKVDGMIADAPVREGWLTNFRAKFIDPYDRVKQFMTFAKEQKPDLSPDSDVYLLVRNAGRYYGKVDHYFRYGQSYIDKNGKVIKVGDSLLAIIAPIDELGNDMRREFERYLIAKHAIEINERGLVSGLDTDVAEEFLSEVENSDYADLFEEQAEKLYGFQTFIMERLVEEGRVFTMDDLYGKTGDDGILVYENYIPWFRAIDPHTPGTGVNKKAGNRGTGVMRQKGGDMPIKSPLENIAHNTEKLISISQYNKALNALYDIMQMKDIRGTGEWLREVPPDKLPVNVNIGNELKKMLKQGEITQDQLGSIDLNELLTTVFVNKNIGKEREGIISFYRDGVPTFLEVRDKELFTELMSLDSEQLKTLSKFGRFFNRILSFAHTSFPKFAIGNLQSDSFTTAIFSKSGFVPLLDSWKAFFKVLKMDEDFQRYMLAGGTMNQFESYDARKPSDFLLTKKQEETMAKKMLEALNVFKQAEKISMAAEYSAKLGTFLREEKAGASTLEAVEEAASIMIDHTQKGRHVAQLQSWVAFSGGFIKGTDKIVQEFKAKPARTALRSLAYITIPTLLLFAMNRKNPNYMEKPEWEKTTFWHIPIGDPLTTKWFLPIKRPYTLGFMFGTIPQKFLEWLSEDSPDAFDDIIEQGFKEFLFEPTILPLQLPWELQFNVNTFTGAPIVPQRELKLPAKEQYGPYTPEVWKYVGAATNISPRKLDHVNKQLTGEVGKMFTSALDWMLPPIEGGEKPKKDFVDIPVIGTFVSKTSTSSTSTIDRFYKEKDELEKLSNKSKLTDADRQKLAKYDSMKRIAQTLSEYRRIERQARADTSLNAEQKALTIEKLQTYQLNLIRGFYGLAPMP